MLWRYDLTPTVKFKTNNLFFFIMLLDAIILVVERDAILVDLFDLL